MEFKKIKIRNVTLNIPADAKFRESKNDDENDKKIMLHIYILKIMI